MLLELTHVTVFDYAEPVTEAYMEFRLTPLSDSKQHVLQHQQRVTPARSIRQYTDAYGNVVNYFNLLDPHTQVEVRFDSVVETHEACVRGAAVGMGQLDSALGRVTLHDYLQPTALTAWSTEFQEFVNPFENLRGRPPQEAARILAAELNYRFRYEGEVTNVSSPITDMLRMGGGVCQDFAHLMLATCRYLGFAARYASGYVLPDDGTEASASHAWVEVFDPEQGWFGVDPTHNQVAGERYVYLGIGRDFQDVPPNRGIFRGQAEESMQIRVHLKPISSDDLGRRAREVYTQRRPVPSMPRQTRRPEAMSLMEQVQTAQQQQQQQQ
jgi:transglutaminase-like putative cysteine protease